MNYIIKPASFGSISSGTMRTEDLVSAYASELEYQMDRQVARFPRRDMRKTINDAGRITDYDSEEAGYCLDDLIGHLETFAPPYAYFGGHEGDGADYGYWLSLDDFDGLTVDDTADVPRDYSGEVLHVNDHGNATLYVANGRGKLREVWALV